MGEYLKAVGGQALKERVPEAAAGIAFFAFFSLFPLMLLGISVGGYFLEAEEVQQYILDMVVQFVPVTWHDLIRENVVAVLKNRESVGLIGILTLLWTSSTVFSMIGRNLSRAWPEKPVRNPVKNRLLGFSVVVGVFLLMLSFSLTNAILGFLKDIGNIIPGFSYLYTIISRLLIHFFVFLSLLMLYKWVPRADVHWTQASAGAVAATILTQAISIGFGWYLQEGVNRYNLVYGSLGAVVAFLFWLYLISVVILLCAHISSAFGRTGNGNHHDAQE